MFAELSGAGRFVLPGQSVRVCSSRVPLFRVVVSTAQEQAPKVRELPEQGIGGWIVPAGDFVLCTTRLRYRIAAEPKFRKEIHEKLYERS